MGWKVSDDSVMERTILDFKKTNMFDQFDNFQLTNAAFYSILKVGFFKVKNRKTYKVGYKLIKIAYKALLNPRNLEGGQFPPPPLSQFFWL